MQWESSEVIASDGVRLAVFRGGRTDGVPLLLVHGYPDDHRVWDGVADLLAPDFALIAFDVRGAGSSGVPADRAGYRVDQLADDIALVAASVGPVHLVAHDWGSTQSWAAVTRPGAAERFASYTSVSGPDLGMSGAWLRRTWRTDRATVVTQAAKSWYLQFFRLPVLPELFWRSGLGFRAIGRPRTPSALANALHGLNLYRANLARGAGRRPAGCELPVLVLAPRFDRYISVPIQTLAPAHYTANLRTEIVAGGHWVLERHPDRITGPVQEFLAQLG